MNNPASIAQRVLTGDEIRDEIHNAIGFGFDPGELQQVNADDLMNVARALLSKLRAPVADIRIGVSATSQGAAICIMQPHADGSTTTIYSEMHPLGDSMGNAALVSAPVADERALPPLPHIPTSYLQLKNLDKIHGMMRDYARFALASAPAACATDVCQAGRSDGVLCADDECDRASGVRPASAPVADERAAVDPCGYVAVKVSAVDWLKDKFPALTIKAGLCERIGGRLYTITRLMRDHDAALASAPVADNSGEKPAGFANCPITGMKFWGNIEHPTLGTVATYGGPFDTYTIPALCDDGELRSEHFDQDAGQWVEGGRPIGWAYHDQKDMRPMQASAPVADERDFENEAHDRDNYLAAQATQSVAALANDPFLAARAWRKPVAANPAGREAISDLAALQWAEKYGIQWALHTPDAIREVIADAQRLAVAHAHGERLARYCPGCGSVGPVERDYHDCCPDGGEAHMVPAALAEKCRETFNIAAKALMKDAAVNDASAQGAGERESWEADMLAAGATHLGGDCWEWESDDFEFKIWQMGVLRAMTRNVAPAGEPESGDA